MSHRELLQQTLDRAKRTARAHPTVVRWLKRIGVGAIALFVTLGALWLLVQWVGIIDAIIYTVLFCAGAAFFPFVIAILGHDVPGNVLIGRLHILMGALAYNHHYLVDMGDRWEWCPGDGDRVYIDDKWHAIEGGFANRSVLGWRPFGILRFKDDGTLKDVRADTKATRGRHGCGVSADGGSVDIARGSYTERAAPIETGIDGTWIVDLKRLFSRGVRRFGDTELIETAEEVIERGEVNPSSFDDWRPMMGALLGLVIGLVVGYLSFMA